MIVPNNAFAFCCGFNQLSFLLLRCCRNSQSIFKICDVFRDGHLILTKLIEHVKQRQHGGGVTVENQNQAETHQNNDSVSQSEPEAQQNVPESQQEEPEAAWPEYFEPGRYEGVPNEVYHAANGISSTQVKDARVSLMYFNARHVEKTIVKERSPVLDMGNLVHALALQPENLEAEFSVEPEIPEGAFTTTATLREFIDAHNASLPALLSADDIKALLEEYNATLPAPVKTSGSRDALLEQLAIINPDLVAQEAQKSSPLKVSGTKADLIQAVKSVNPAAVFADELLDAWRENTEGKVLVTRQQLSTALNIQKALLEHPTAGKLLTHPSRAVEVSYFGIDEETGLEVRVQQVPLIRQKQSVRISNHRKRCWVLRCSPN